ncbi:MAG: hypothetical protein FJX11_05170 [Alphaproteobacteria bacterium]|nr:hypothetical protein [Alphaproteobacteria bacterium]
MTKSVGGGRVLVRTLMLATTALTAPFLVGGAAAKVGVTSATDGDPLGKPPAAAERVLRIGIDVQANELITTRANDRAHLLFLDGSSLTVGPNAQLTIDKFVFDPNTKTGELAINASRGVMRLVGGKISKTNPITITTPSSTIGIRGGITLVDAQSSQTTSTFVFGTNMTVSGAGQTQNVTRPGSQVTTSLGGVPGAPTLARQASLTGQLNQLEGTSGSGGGSSNRSTSSGATQATGNADQAAQSSGFSAQNSGQGTGASQTATAANNFGSGPGPRNRNPNDTITTAITNSQQAVQQSQATTQTSTQTQPTVIVTRGGFAIEPTYTNFNRTTLGVTEIPGNRRQLQQSGTLLNGTATITLDDGRSLSVPWQPGAGTIAVSLTHSTLGTLTGSGFVTADQNFFAYGLTDGTGRRVGLVGGTPTALAQFPTTGFAAHNLSALSETGGKLPFSNSTVGKDPNLLAAASSSPLYSVYSPQTGSPIGAPASTAQGASAMQGTMALSGQGSTQKSYIGVFVGDYFRDYNNNTLFNSGGFNATYRTGAADRIGRQVSAESTFNVGGANSIFGPNADNMVYTTDSVRTDITVSGGLTQTATTTRTTQASFDQPYNNLNGSDYSGVTLAAKTTTPSSVGQNRTNRSLTGYVGGIVEGRDSSGNFSSRIIGGNTASSGNTIALQTSASNNRAAAQITITNWDGTSTSATFQLGGLTGGRFSTSSFIDDTLYALRDRQAANFPSGPTTSVTTGTGTSTGADVTSRTAMLSYSTAPVGSFFTASGVTPCTCEFLTWGWWAGDVNYSASSVYNAEGRDRLHLATYVAGTQTTVANLNALTGSATYSGHLTGNVQNGVNSYVAVGSYSNVWNYGTRNGVASVTFDGATFGGGMTANTFGSNTTNTFATTAPLSSTGVTGRSLTLNGTFFSSPTVEAKGQGGNFAITGTGYKAGGTFAAQKP